MSNRIYVATESFIGMLDGRMQVVHAGKTTVREGHPVMRGREHFFEELSVTFDLPRQAEESEAPEVEEARQDKDAAPVEQATKRPGEKRTTKRKPTK